MKILVLDLETASHDTSIDALRNLENSIITEIGIVQLNLLTGEIDPVFNQVCRENKTCSPDSWVFKNSSLSPEEVEASKHIEDYGEELQRLFDEQFVTSWWHDYDFRRLEHQSRGFTIHNKFWDPALTLVPYMKIPFPNGTGLKRPSVSEAYRYFNPGKSLTHPHRALKDATIEAQIIFQAVQKWPELLKEWERYV